MDERCDDIMVDGRWMRGIKPALTREDAGKGGRMGRGGSAALGGVGIHACGVILTPAFRGKASEEEAEQTPVEERAPPQAFAGAEARWRKSTGHRRSGRE